MTNTPLILLAAGGTGGHLFPAEALGVELIRRGLRVRLATDARALRYSGLFSKDNIDVVPSETVRGRNPLSLARTAIMLGYGTAVALNLVRRLKPAAVVGFGGYPTVPPLMAARLLGVPGIIHDANAVLGRANRFLSGRVNAIATSLPGVLDRDPALAGKATTVGTPMRPAIFAAAAVPFASPEPNGPLRILVVGGSQGARVMSDIVPAAIERLEPVLWSRLDPDAAGARGRHGAGARSLRPAQDQRRTCAVLQRSAGAAGVEPSGGVALRRRHGGRTRRDRPALDPGAVARRDRSGPVRQCRRAVAGERRACALRRPNSRRTGWPRKFPRSPPNRRG